MSMSADFSHSLKTFLARNPESAKLLIDFWMELVESTGWNADDEIDMLNNSKGINSAIDNLIDDAIANVIQ